MHLSPRLQVSLYVSVIVRIRLERSLIMAAHSEYTDEDYTMLPLRFLLSVVETRAAAFQVGLFSHIVSRRFVASS